MNEERVVVLSGPLSGRQFAFDRLLSIGRNPQNTIILDDPEISRRHATLTAENGTVILRDLGSGNGTYVNGDRVVEKILKNGQAFRIGPVEMVYETEAADSAAGRRSDASVSFDDKVRGRVHAVPTDGRLGVNLFQPLIERDARTVSLEGSDARAIQDKLTAVYAANQIVSQEHELKPLFERLMDQIFRLVPANNALILLRDGKTGELTPVCTRSEEHEDEISVSTTIINQTLEKGESLMVEDASLDERFRGAGSVMESCIASALCVPLISANERLGVIYVDTKGTRNAFTNADLDLLVALAGPSAIAIKNAQYVEQLEEDFKMTLRLLVNAIEMRDHYTVGHAWRVTHFSLEIAKELGWSDEHLRELEIGGVLHDVGKIALSDSVLHNPGKLSDEEYAHMQIHPEKGAALMRDCEKLRDFIPYCLYHHERYDGKGYPYGLKGEDIPIEGRVVAVADAFDAMTSNRPYRPARDAESAVEELKDNKGKQFDPDCVDAFLRAYESGLINHVLQKYHEDDTASLACPFCSTYVQAPENAAEGDVFSCAVCRRDLMLKGEDGAFEGVLLTEADMQKRGENPDDQDSDRNRLETTGGVGAASGLSSGSISSHDEVHPVRP